MQQTATGIQTDDLDNVIVKVGGTQVSPSNNRYLQQALSHPDRKESAVTAVAPASNLHPPNSKPSQSITPMSSSVNMHPLSGMTTLLHNRELSGKSGDFTANKSMPSVGRSMAASSGH